MTTPDTAEAGRRTVSVIFSDLAGSTAMQEALDAESVRRVMARYYEVMRDIVHRHGGTVEKFIGDAVVAVFGKPAVREDDALRAVRCAGEMTRGLEQLGDELERNWGVRLSMRTGVNTGELVLSSEGIMVGDTMNTAARLEQAAPAGEVLLGESTWRLVRQHVIGEEIAPLDLKGKAAPVRAWRLVTADAPATSIPVDAPLVGRAAELARLRTALDQAISGRGCRLVTVVGSPGLGKSRLAAELSRQIAGTARVLSGHCEPSGEGNTFLPVAEVVREVAGIAEADPLEVVREKLRALTPDDDPDRERLVDRVAGVLGTGEPASAQETFWALRRGLEVLARQQPLVVVLDDLHWGQPMLLDLVEHLVEWISDAPILLVALARPELRESREVLTAVGRRASDVIELEPLEPGESRALVDGLLGSSDLPAELIDRILETTEGNPLFLGELIRMLLDDGTLVREGDSWAVAGGASAVDVPPTIHALLSARIERLRADERAVVERAAVIGKQFYRGAVAELLAPALRTEIDGHLEALRRKEMVEPEGIYWIDEPVYRFHHVLIRDAAYRLLLKEARAVLHERFADWLQEKAGEMVGEYEEVIAFHLEQAHSYRRELGPLDDAGRVLGARAATLLLSAGRRALAREDLAAAENLLSRALARESGAATSILWDLAETVLSSGDAAAATAVIDQFTAAVADDRLGQLRATVLRAQRANLTGEDDPAATPEAVSAAASELGELDDGPGEAKAWAVLAQTNARLGRVGEVETALDRALTAARAADDRRRTTAVLAAAPRAALWGPSTVVRASGRCLDVVRILRMTPGNRHVEALALRCQAVLEAMRGRIDAGREILDGARATLEELGLSLELHETEVYAGMVELLADDPAAAAGHLRAALAGFESLGAEAAAAHAAAQLARALVARGEPGDAEAALAQVAFAQRHGGEDLRTTIIAGSARGEALAQSGQVDDALASARLAVGLADPTDALADKADAAMSLARVLLTAGLQDEAREAALSAREFYEAKGHTVGADRAARVAGPELIAEWTPEQQAELAIQTARPTLTESERLEAEVACRYNTHDADRLAELYSEAYTVVDHRANGWGTISGRDELRERMAAGFKMTPDARMELDEVLAADDRVIACRGAYRGHFEEGGGEFELPIGYVSVYENGQALSTDVYEPHDRQAMIARYAELGGGLSALGDSPLERFYAEFARRFARHEMEPFLELVAEDYLLVDHRMIGWEPIRGRAGLAALTESAWAGSRDMRIEVEEVLAATDRVLAVRIRWIGQALEGGGSYVTDVGHVGVLENGQILAVDQYRSEDREAMLERVAELSGGDKPPERFLTELQRLLDGREYDQLLPLIAEDWTSVDHRAIGWEDMHGRDAWEASTRSFFDASPTARAEIDEVLACDDRVIAVRMAWRDAGVKAGELELVAGAVYLIEDGQWISVDYYDPDDRQAMIASYVELGGGLSALGPTPAGQVLAEFARCYARQDTEALLRCVDEEITFTDHRQLGWDPVRGSHGFVELMRTGWNALDIRMQPDEVLAAGDRVIALRFAWAGTGDAEWGGGPFALAVGNVFVVDDGRIVSVDQYAADDRDVMLARFRELSRTETPPSLVVNAEELRRYNARDGDPADWAESYASLYAEDFFLADHRPNGWGRIEGREGVRAQIQIVRAISADVRMERDDLIAADDRVLALLIGYRGHANEGGGEFELIVGYVSVYEDGQVLSTDVYEPDDRQAMIARYVELGGGLNALGDSPAERACAEHSRRLARRDLEAILDQYREDFVLRDHRATVSKDVPMAEVRASFEAVFSVTEVLRLDTDEVLACDGRVIARRIAYRGTASDGGGYLEVRTGFVSVVEDGLFVSTDMYEYDDAEAMLARFAELSAQPEQSQQRSSARWVMQYMDAYNRHDPDGFAPLFGEDFVLVDHRASGWGRIDGPAAMLENHAAAFQMSPDVRVEIENVLAGDHRVGAVCFTYSGHMTDGGGEFEYSIGYVTLVEDGRALSTDAYEPDDRLAMIARYTELGGGLSALGDSPLERWFAEYARRFAARDVESLLELVSEDYVVIDHRVLGWEPVRGHEGCVALNVSAWEASRDIRIEVDEMVAVNERVAALRIRWIGHAIDGGGEFVAEAGQVGVVENGRVVRVEQFDPDDRDAMLARYAELAGTVRD